MRVVLGNRNAIQTVRTGDPDEPEKVQKLPRGKRATEIDIPDEKSLGEAFTTITHPQGVWASHASEGATPAWVASDNGSLATLLAEHFGGIEIRKLDVNPGSSRTARAGARASSAAGTALLLGLMLWLVSVMGSLFLRTNAGADFQAKQMGGAASATAVAKWMALTANATAPAAGDTTLTGEITTAGGGLVRAAGTYAHTGGAASYTVSNTFTANGSDSLPVTIAKAGVFDAASGGNLVFETLLTTTATLSASGDALTLTQTVTL